MRSAPLLLLLSGLACAHQALAPGQAQVLSAVRDFRSLTVDGFAPYYVDDKRNALAIDAAVHKDKFASSEATFRGDAGTYDLTITTLTEKDGESTYRLIVDGNVIGTYQNPPASPNYRETTHTWPGVKLRDGARLQIESNTHSNRQVPEGDGFGYARGRWTQLVVTRKG